jgi:hypothetical protein
MQQHLCCRRPQVAAFLWSQLRRDVSVGHERTSSLRVEPCAGGSKRSIPPAPTAAPGPSVRERSEGSASDSVTGRRQYMRRVLQYCTGGTGAERNTHGLRPTTTEQRVYALLFLVRHHHFKRTAVEQTLIVRPKADLYVLEGRLRHDSVRWDGVEGLSASGVASADVLHDYGVPAPPSHWALHAAVEQRTAKRMTRCW